jgi:phospholipid/cholesterol/gamma-HCH transport system substrate-binding protein
VHSDAGEPLLMATIMKRRVRRAAGAAAIAVAVVGVNSSCSLGTRHASSYCADMPDTIGLYIGNPVTQMGYEIGKVTGIKAGPTQVRVDFSVTEKRELPSDVKAIIRSPSILADRSLELVGNYAGGAQLDPASCIPLGRSVSPKLLSEVIGSADTFLNAINSNGSTNIADAIRGVDRLADNNGAAVGHLLEVSSALLDSPDQAISDIGSIIKNLATLTTALREIRGPLKEILVDAPGTTVDVARALDGTARLAGKHKLGNLGPIIETVAVLETSLGEETQLTLDTISAAVRKISPHANALASLFDGVPWWINTAANHFNAEHFGTFNIAYRPPLFRVATHDKLAVCGAMNASMPGSCADVNGQPYAVDVALLQYVLQQASHQ